MHLADFLLNVQVHVLYVTRPSRLRRCGAGYARLARVVTTVSIVFGGQKRKCVIKRHQCAELLRNFAAYCVISRHNLLDHAHQQKRLSPLAHGSFPRLLSQNNRLARETNTKTDAGKRQLPLSVPNACALFYIWMIPSGPRAS